MLELLPSAPSVFASALVALGGWLLGAVLWLAVGRFEAWSRKQGFRAAAGPAGRVVSLGRAPSGASAVRASGIADGRFVSDIK